MPPSCVPLRPQHRSSIRRPYPGPASIRRSSPGPASQPRPCAAHHRGSCPCTPPALPPLAPSGALPAPSSVLAIPNSPTNYYRGLGDEVRQFSRGWARKATGRATPGRPCRECCPCQCSCPPSRRLGVTPYGTPVAAPALESPSPTKPAAPKASAVTEAAAPFVSRRQRWAGPIPLRLGPEGDWSAKIRRTLFDPVRGDGLDSPASPTLWATEGGPPSSVATSCVAGPARPFMTRAQVRRPTDAFGDEAEEGEVAGGSEKEAV